MDKELILKYKAEFDHWLKGGNVQVYYKKDDEPKWWTDKESINYGGDDNFSNIIDKSLSPDYVLVVIDDEYVEFRKALAEGRTVQYNFGNYGINIKNFPNTWKDLDPSIGILADKACPENYRIKPEVPKFKAGDWVVHPEAEYPWRITQNSLDKLDNTELKLWKPKLGEWCWFSNDKSYDTPCLRKFITIIDDTYIALNSQNSKCITPTEVPSFEKGISDSYVTYKNCEPFIGQLPSCLKE